MVFVLFGLMWTIISVIITIAMYSGAAGTITVNDVIVSQAEFSEMLGPKIFMITFIVIGIVIFFFGLKMVKKDLSTRVKGEICYGKICDIYASQMIQNGYPAYKADVYVNIPSTGEKKIVSEYIGYDPLKYPIDTFVEVKYNKDDINFIRSVDVSELPEGIEEKLMDVSFYNLNKDIKLEEQIEENEEYPNLEKYNHGARIEKEQTEGEKDILRLFIYVFGISVIAIVMLLI